MDPELKAILTKITDLLEIIAFANVGQECQHRNITDLSVMGQEPMTKIYCNDCKQFLEQSGG